MSAFSELTCNFSYCGN